jgi:hypothetical protein
MKFHTTHTDGSTTYYAAGEYRIAQSPVGMGWWKCHCYRGDEPIGSFVSEGALSAAMAHCEDVERRRAA